LHILDFNVDKMLIKRPRKWVKNRVLSTLDFCGFAGFLHMSLYTPSFLSFAGEPFVLTRRVYHISLSHLKLLYLPQFRSPALSHKKGGGCDRAVTVAVTML